MYDHYGANIIQLIAACNSIKQLFDGSAFLRDGCIVVLLFYKWIAPGILFIDWRKRSVSVN